jgi:hypothetical protein
MIILTIRAYFSPIWHDIAMIPEVPGLKSPAVLRHGARASYGAAWLEICAPSSDQRKEPTGKSYGAARFEICGTSSRAVVLKPSTAHKLQYMHHHSRKRIIAVRCT